MQQLTFNVKELCESDDWRKEIGDNYGRLVMKECPDWGRTWHWVMATRKGGSQGRAYCLEQWDGAVMEYIEENMPCIITYGEVCDIDGEYCECKLGESYDVSYTCLTDEEFDLVCKARSMFVALEEEMDSDTD